MARLGKTGTLALLLFGGGVLALIAGFGRVASVDAETRPATQALVPGVAVYVNDFELPAVAPSPTQNKGPATTTGANPADHTADEADIPSVQARMLTDAFSKTLVETLQKIGFTATRVREKPGGKGVLLRGVFAELDRENRIRRVILGAGSPNPQFFLYVGTFNLKSPDQPLYEPAGIRGDGPTTAARYWGLTQQEYYKKAGVWPLDPDGEVLVMLMIEDTLAIENLDDILAKVPGIGLILIGEGDLSQELGFPRQYEHPQVLDAMKHIVDTCKKRKVAVGHPHVDATNVERILDEGYTFLMAAPTRSFAALDKGRTLAKR